MEEKAISRKQKLILDFIEEFNRQKGYSPSYRDMMRHFELASPSSIHKHVQKLKKFGLVQNTRQILPLQKKTKHVEIPFMGLLAQGKPLITEKNFQSLRIPKNFAPNPEISYLLKVLDDSLADEMMMKDDLVVVETEIKKGALSLAMNDAQESVIGRYLPQVTHILIESQNPALRPKIFRKDKLQVQGCIVSLLRSY